MLSTHETKQAVIRDNALILYFENAETPFVARFDLDSLAQANFEVADKKENFFELTLRDFTGTTQVIGQFATKADAHQALYAILQALVSHKEENVVVVEKASAACGFGCVLGKILKWLLIIIGAIVVIYYILGQIPAPGSAQKINATNAPVAAPVMSEAPAASTVHEGGLSTAPEGEGVNADALLGGQSTPPAASEETPQSSSAPAAE